MSCGDVSVVVVSHDRPRDLRLCLLALRQLYYPSFEIIVVADQASANGLEEQPGVSVIPFDEANISKARNIGAANAAGDIIAFIDDDAVPEPTWLDHLIAPFAEQEVAITGGYVIGRNGFSLQWGALSVDEAGWSHPVDVTGNDTLVLAMDRDGRAIRTQGTNMAIRRSVLASLGGFDPTFAFYHDESDLNVRVARAGHLTAIVPRARVYHKSSASARRRADRAPRTLFDVGASSAVFHRKYLGPRDWASAREDLLNSERLRLDQMLVEGRLEPKSFETLLRGLHEGYNEGLERVSGDAQPIDPPARPFVGVGGHYPDHKVLVSRFWNRRQMRRKAAQMVRDGHVVTLLIMEPSTRFHKLTFSDQGFWEQSGGIFGKAERSDPFVRVMSLAARAAAELQRISFFRNPIAPT